MARPESAALTLLPSGRLLLGAVSDNQVACRTVIITHLPSELYFHLNRFITVNMMLVLLVQSCPLLGQKSHKGEDYLSHPHLIPTLWNSACHLGRAP